MKGEITGKEQQNAKFIVIFSQFGQFDDKHYLTVSSGTVMIGEMKYLKKKNHNLRVLSVL